jgi:hypothetical protein
MKSENIFPCISLNIHHTKKIQTKVVVVTRSIFYVYNFLSSVLEKIDRVRFESHVRQGLHWTDTNQIKLNQQTHLV